LDQRLADETRMLFQEELDATQTLERIQGQTDSTGGESPLPKMTAYDVLLKLNDELPSRKDVTLNITNMSIKPGKVSINKATAASNAEIDKIEESLKKIECFDDVTRGTISTLKEGELRFSFDIKSSCM
ncbi:MAG: hypothetical protein AAGC55_22755, partial [Myxococcota bacterium]